MSEKPDIVLVYAPWDIKFYQAPGLPILAGYLISQDISVDILDAVALNIDHKETVEQIAKIDAGIIGLSIPFTAMISTSIELLKLITKEFSDKLVLCGGYHATIRPQDVASYCDMVVAVGRLLP